MEYSIIIKINHDGPGKSENEFLYNSDTGLFCQYSPIVPIRSFENWNDLMGFLLNEWEIIYIEISPLM